MNEEVNAVQLSLRSMRTWVQTQHFQIVFSLFWTMVLAKKQQTSLHAHIQSMCAQPARRIHAKSRFSSIESSSGFSFQISNELLNFRQCPFSSVLSNFECFELIDVDIPTWGEKMFEFKLRSFCLSLALSIDAQHVE